MIKIGDFDFGQEFIALAFELRKTQLLLEKLINAPAVRGYVSPADVLAAEEDAIRYLQEKYPSMGIQKKEKQA